MAYEPQDPARPRSQASSRTTETTSTGSLSRDAWQYDGPDELVGIFGEAWYHDCAGGDGAECLQFPAGSIDRPHGETDFYTLLACPDCGATHVILVRDYTGWDEPADYGFDQTWDQPRDATGIDCFEAHEGITA